MKQSIMNNNSNQLWSKSFTVPLVNGANDKLIIDFNRIRFYGAPKTKKILSNDAIFANRDNLINSWKNNFIDLELRDATKIGWFNTFTIFINNADEEGIDLPSKSSVESWERLIVNQARAGKYKSSTAIKYFSIIKSLHKYFGYPYKEWFSPHALLPKEKTFPKYGYSDKELINLLKTLHKVFHKLESKISKNISQYIPAKSNSLNNNSNLDNDTEISTEITRRFSAAAFIFSYYTWGNLSTILNAPKPKKIETENGKWYFAEVEKHRANKFVTLELGTNNDLTVPKHALRFINKLLNLSNTLCPNIDNLFIQRDKGKFSSLKGSCLYKFKNWLAREFDIIGDDGTLLSINITKLRKTMSSRHLAITNDPIETAILLGNTPKVLRKHYSQGNEGNNRKQLIATSMALEEAIRLKDIQKGKKQAAKRLNLEILPYEEFLNKYKKNGILQPQVTPIGTGCKGGNSNQQKTYNKKMEFNNLTDKSQKLACADILSCFFCKNQVIIEEVDDIWCLLSFRDSIYESQLDYASYSHFYKNRSELLIKIDNTLKLIDPIVCKKAKDKLQNNGRHPLWPEKYNYTF